MFVHISVPTRGYYGETLYFRAVFRSLLLRQED